MLAAPTTRMFEIVLESFIHPVLVQTILVKAVV